jgi:hypothetical protein
MPTVLRVGPYRFFFFSNEGREPPDIHVKARGDEAKFWLEPVALASNYGFNNRELKQMNDLIEQHVDKFLEAWHEHVG